jgi:hypothetical protein
LLAAVFAWHGHGKRPRCCCGTAAVLAILQHHYLRRQNSEPACRSQINLRVRLAVLNVFGRQDELKPPPHVEWHQTDIN